MKSLVLLGLAFLAVANGAAIPNAQCNEQNFEGCMNSFSELLDLPGLPSNPVDLIAQINKLIATKGATGQQQVCGAFVFLRTCLGDQYDTCLSVPYLETLGLSASDAQALVDEAAKEQKQCTQSAVRSKFVATPNAQCNEENFEGCMNSFSELLDLPGLPANPVDLIAQINKLIATKGATGQQQVCGAFVFLRTCLGDQYDTCLSVPYLETLGLSASDAQALVDEAAKEQKQCTSVVRSAYATKSNAQCNEQNFEGCMNSFSELLDLPGLPANPVDLIAQINKLIATKGATGQQQVCGAFVFLRTCLGDQYDTCLSVPYLETLGLSASDAQALVDEAAKEQKQCTSRVKTAFAAIRNTQCNEQNLVSCMGLFAELLDLPALPSNPMDLITQANKLVATKGATGAQQVCGAMVFLRTCLGAQYDTCLSVDNLETLGVMASDAQTLVKTAAQEQQQCTTLAVRSRFAATANAQCNEQNFGICTTSFAQLLDLPEMPSDPNQLIAQMDKLLTTKGLAGQQQICNAMIYLRTCLGDQYDSCMSVQFLQTIGVKVSDAQVLVEMAAQQQYICTAGWGAYSKNWDCINSVGQTDKQALGQCQADYGMSMAKDPTNACKYNQVLTDCYTKPFKQSCDPSAALVLCNSMKASFVPLFPQCQITC